MTKEHGDGTGMKDLFSQQGTSIRSKLLFTGMATTFCVLLTASIIILTSEFLSFRQSLIDNLTGYAQTISANSTAALSFGDNKSAEETLATLKSVPSIIGAVIYDKQGGAFASYLRDEKTWVVENGQPLRKGYRFTLRFVDYYYPISLERETIGAVHIRSDLGGLYARAMRYGITLAIIMLIACLMSYVLFTKLHKAITKPIFDLMDLMYVVSKEQDYSVRARAQGHDELTYLVHGFNDMLEKIHERDTELAGYRMSLEELVAERTAQLRTTNTELENELAERTRMEKALHESETKYRTIFETTGNASIIVEYDMGIFMINSAFEQLSGYRRDEVEGKMSWTDFIAEEDQEKLRHYHYMRRIDPQSVPGDYECRVVDRSGNIKNIYLTEAIIPGTDRSVASFLDITDRKRLEEHLMQSQKIEAVGQLAGGVAHDFNNILTAIIGYGNLLKDELEGSERLGTYTNYILTSADKAKHLTQALLTFSRKQLMAPRPIDLNKIINNMHNLLVRLIGEDIKIKIEAVQRDLVVFADPGQIEQILMNFATNARDAMPEGGLFTIRTEVVTFNDEFLRRFPQGQAGKKYAVFTVSDTGSGIDKKNLDHLFEPFFTTKEVGKGTGLGLSIIHGIVNQNNGYITVESELQKGTQFAVYLPLLEAQAEEESRPVMPKLKGGTETILVAEDDKQTLSFITEILQRHGYSVIGTADGEEAVKRFRELQDTIALVLLDVIMPNKNGRIVYDEIRLIDENVKTLFMSGYTADIIHKKGIFESNINFLSKPIISGALLTKVREILDSQ